MVTGYNAIAPEATRIKYAYEDLSLGQFEDLIIVVCQQLFGIGVQGFSTGQGGGLNQRQIFDDRGRCGKHPVFERRRDQQRPGQNHLLVTTLILQKKRLSRPG